VASFIDSVLEIVDDFYANVLQNLKPAVATAPKVKDKPAPTAEDVASQSQCARGNEDNDEDGAPGAQQHVEGLPPHDILL